MSNARESAACGESVAYVSAACEIAVCVSVVYEGAACGSATCESAACESVTSGTPRSEASPVIALCYEVTMCERCQLEHRL